MDATSPISMQRPPHRRRSIVLVVAVLVLVWGILQWCQPPDSGAPVSPAEVPARTSASQTAMEGTGSPTAESLSTASPSPHGSRMIALTLQFKGGHLIETGREEHAGTVRPLRGIDGQPGLYHRIVDPAGRVVFENLEADPSLVHYDTTDDGKTLIGGRVLLPDMPVHLRLPSGVAGRLEVYKMEAGTWTRAAKPAPTTLVGTFDLP